MYWIITKNKLTNHVAAEVVQAHTGVVYYLYGFPTSSAQLLVALSINDCYILGKKTTLNVAKKALSTEVWISILIQDSINLLADYQAANNVHVNMVYGMGGSRVFLSYNEKRELPNIVSNNTALKHKINLNGKPTDILVLLNEITKKLIAYEIDIGFELKKCLDDTRATNKLKVQGVM